MPIYKFHKRAYIKYNGDNKSLFHLNFECAVAVIFFVLKLSWC